MTHRTISLLFLALLVLPCFAASKYESKITSLEGEKWWGGAVGLGARMPFEGDLRLFDLSAENLNNQNVPLLLSSEGRYIWSDKPRMESCVCIPIMRRWNRYWRAVR